MSDTKGGYPAGRSEGELKPPPVSVTRLQRAMLLHGTDFDRSHYGPVTGAAVEQIRSTRQGTGVKRFVMVRDEDVSGVSGTGIVAEGVKFSDGVCVIHWCGEYPTSTVHERGIDSILAIHGHEGRTRIEWLDE